MKPIKLKISGLNSFKDEQEIDFAKLSDLGIFGIFGPTGSGKSSILDAMTLALYGTVVRAGKGKKDIMNHAENSLHVSFEFALGVGEQRSTYQVDKVYRREKDGVTVKNLHSRLVELTDDAEIILAEREKEVNAYIVRLLGLKVDDFTRAVVLPQGNFASFLKLDSSSRREMLERLFSLEKYGRQLTDKLNSRHVAISTQLNQLDGEQRGLGDASTERLQAAQAQQERATAAEQVAVARLAELTVSYEQGRKIVELQQELATKERELTQLRFKSDHIKQLSVEVQRVEQARQMRPVIEERNALAAKALEAEEKCNSARILAIKLKTQSEQCSETLQLARGKRAEQEPKLFEHKTQLDAARSQEAETIELEQKIAELAEQITDVTAQLTETSKRLEIAASEARSLSQEILDLEQTADQNSVTAEYRQLVQLVGSQADNLEREMTILQNCRIDGEKRQENLTAIAVALTAAEATVSLLTAELIALADLEKDAQAKCPGDEAILGQREVRLTELKTLLGEMEIQQQSIETESRSIGHYRSELTAAQTVEQKVAAEYQIAQQAVNELNRQLTELLANNNLAMAAKLAAELKEGQPCPVCGSGHHPELAAIPVHYADQAERDQLEEELALTKARVSNLELSLRQAEAQVVGSRTQLATIQDRLKSLAVQFTQKLAVLADSWGLDKDKTDLTALIRLVKGQEQQLKQEKEALQRWRSDRIAAEVRYREQEQRLAKAKTETAARQAAHRAAQVESDRTKADLVTLTHRLAGLCGEALALLTQLGVVPYSDPALIIHAISDLREAVKERDRQFEALQAQLRQKRSQQQARQSEQEELRHTEQRLTVSLSACRSQQEEFNRAAKEKRAALNRLTKGIPVLVLITQAEGELAELRQSEKTAEEQFFLTQKAFLDTQQQLTIQQTQFSGLLEQVQKIDAHLQHLLVELNFESIEAVEKAYLDDAALERKRLTIKSYQDVEHRLDVQREEVMTKLAGRHISEEAWQELTQQQQLVLREKEQASELRIAADRDLSELSSRHERWQALENALINVKRQNTHITTLKSLLRGNAMVEFMAQEQMGVVLVHASERLKQLTSNRYGLELASDGTFLIRDDDNAGVKRPVNMLSGGETFQTSLALALALSTQIQLRGRHPLEFFFLDEGFGSLDQKSLDIVISCLERLPFERMTIGLISHVEILRQRLLRRLIVKPAEPNGRGSQVQIEIE